MSQNDETARDESAESAALDPASAPAPAPPDHVEVQLAYAGASSLVAAGATAELALVGNLRRPPVRFEATIKDPLRFREALSALYAVVGSDYRYVPKDRTAYVAYQRMRRESAGQGLWQAQRAYFAWLLQNDPTAYLILDPVITVHPDQVFFEVFSKDEGAYAKLGVDRDAFEQAGQAVEHGTTNIDFSPSLFAALQQMRSYRATRLSLGRDGVKLATGAASEVLEKQIRVPDSWLRGFLQVQSAAALPRDTFTLAPIDLYNVLRQLRLQADRKGQRRGLRVELAPGEPPRLVLEPWETLVPSTGGIYKGKGAKVVRLWGRRRLSALRRFLPFAEEVEVSVLGSGLPSFWVLRGGAFSLTLGLTGFTSANWSQAISFDLLLPRRTRSTPPLDAVLDHLGATWSAGAGELARATGLTWPVLVEALQLGCQQGKLMYDLAADVYRLRPLTEEPLDLTRLEYRNPRERVAHDLLVRRGAVKIVAENRIPTAGLELTGKVVVDEERREYRPQLLLADEGQVSRAECTCPSFRKQGLKAGPCVHLIALRLAYAEQEARLKKGGESSSALTVETRTYSRRDPRGEEVHQVSLERRRLRIRWGRTGATPRLQTLTFDTLDDARAAFLARIGELDARGFLDATAG